MLVGKVKKLIPDKGFGFILPDDGGDDVFFHFTAVTAAGFESLEVGQSVSYDLQTDSPNRDTRRRAINVTRFRGQILPAAGQPSLVPVARHSLARGKKPSWKGR